MQKQWKRFVRNRDAIAHMFRPGFGLKRWIGLLFVGVFIIGFAVALTLQQLSASAMAWLHFLTLDLLSPWLRAMLFR